MTTPDPADVHTGTDRVELTENEREQINSVLYGGGNGLYYKHDLFAAIGSIVAARLQALTAERDNFEANCAHWMKSYEQQTEFARQMTGERDAARAELAAANTRCAELEAELVAEKEQLRHEVAGLRDERDALQATLDRVTAGPALYLIRNSKTGEWFMGSVSGDGEIWAKNIAMSVVYTSSEQGPTYGLPKDGEWVEFRAALTPEGSE